MLIYISTLKESDGCSFLMLSLNKYSTYKINCNLLCLFSISCVRGHIKTCLGNLKLESKDIMWKSDCTDGQEVRIKSRDQL